ncbi:primase C-terminal domain-containing protein [Thermorudis peleae]|uniref:primase C-terminal domain-containing protein n=1 Tax=Thermorudis peleae TaxID=1382356 RepID=UPI00068E38F8|nr:primase C-terminal domain-containing protein [Thermorudis peleae]
MAGDEALADLEATHEPLPPTPTGLTGGGGAHYHFIAPPDVPTVTLAPGLELKAAGAQVVLPPSRSAAGRYFWDTGAHIADLPLAPLPDWLLPLAHQARRHPGQSSKELPPTIGEGERNRWLTSLAGTLRRRGCTEPEILACLRILNASRCRPPLDERELAKIARSVARYAPARPPDAPVPRSRRRIIRLEVADAR